MRRREAQARGSRRTPHRRPPGPGPQPPHDVTGARRTGTGGRTLTGYRERRGRRPSRRHGTATGTAIVRPLRHVRAVRERHSQRFADPAETAASRSARAWAWALGETATAPVTDRETRSRPPARRSKPRSPRPTNGACVATGKTARMPPRPSCAGSSATTTTSRSAATIWANWWAASVTLSAHAEQIADVLAVAVQGQRRAAAMARNIDAAPPTRQFAKQMPTTSTAWRQLSRGFSANGPRRQSLPAVW